MLSRRAILRTPLPLLTGAISGCISSRLSDNHPILNCIEVVNADTKPHTVHLRVDYENEELFSNSYAIDGREGGGRIQQQWIPREWPDEAGQFRVHVRMDTRSDWVTIESAEELGAYAIQIAYRVGSDGNGIPLWETIDANDYERDCGRSLASN
ncbi:hypothetical protein JMJ58_19045 [Haloterrigena salifodinae]|uniref:Uncharacterized protein n=1 Tax=Haloterrigena salifodinae TaxID=2675099 RepID=A0A8T8E0R6_9EURY|nr:hypothetical protein [Haloterrigena salifodinae]QRV14981.1 hypothetical protein JMJ58_19045 [Haloterrigena salifodinae]